MANYFKAFPKIKYDKKIVRDIFRRVKIIDEVKNSPYVFLPYTLKNGEKAEDVSYHYYGTVNYTWLVYMANDIIDPYTDWHMDQDLFYDFLANKYQEQANTTGFAVVNWTKNEQITDNIIHYQNDSDSDLIISKETHQLNTANTPLDDTFDSSEWSAVRYFDYENELNENKRSIELVDKNFAPRVREELDRLLNE